MLHGKATNFSLLFLHYNHHKQITFIINLYHLDLILHLEYQASQCLNLGFQWDKCGLVHRQSIQVPSQMCD